MTFVRLLRHFHSVSSFFLLTFAIRSAITRENRALFSNQYAIAVRSTPYPACKNVVYSRNLVCSCQKFEKQNRYVGYTGIVIVPVTQTCVNVTKANSRGG